MKLKEYLDRNDTRLVSIEGNLKEHMRRTAVLEKALVPVQEHMKMWALIGKIGLGFLGLLGAVASIAVSVKTLWP